VTGATIIRIFLGVVGAALLIGGVALAFLVGAPLILPTIWMIGSGVVLVIVALIEVSRYRSEAAERQRNTAGPGGGETGLPEPRFRPTDEVFLDPTTQRRMRVFADPHTGERRYVAEG
jgi:hypothetical protein